MKILTVIVTYNPDIVRLEDNIRAAAPQSEHMLIVDNGSGNIAEIEKCAADFAGSYDMIKNSKNLGIASALRTAMDFAADRGYDWVLSLDQDSVAASGLVGAYLPYTRDPSVGALTCHIKDRNFFESFPETVSDVPYCITSGCMMNVSAYKKTSGYDEWMFIDKVDFDICLSLREHGFRIVCVPYSGLFHEVGHGKNVGLFGKRMLSFNQPPWRRYYMTRNGIYLGRKHPSLEHPAKCFARELRDMAIALIYEGDKSAKLKASLKGLIDGFKAEIY